MYNSGIVPEVIALQMDKSKEEILQIIEKTIEDEEKNKKKNMGLSLSSDAKARKDSNVPLITKVYFDKTVNIDNAIKHAQSRMWKALTMKPEFNISMEETQNALNNYAESKTTFVILHIDLVDSTKLSMTLPVNKLVTIIQSFSQEMSVMLSTYGGYVLKYIGDAVLAFFIVDSPNNLYLRCINAMECACSMIKVVRQGINPILNQYDYPELRVRVGIDVGENAVVQFGWDSHTLDGKVIMKSPHFDILGYTISIAAKMTAFAKPDQIVIGQLIYDILEEDKKSTFRLLPINPQVWDYFSNITGGIYHLYSSINENESEYKQNTDNTLRQK
ncbi:MAG: adenylate/guanylate cyclase domain-containing protein [Thermoproteota archaeon]|nr:adenylate/guanylate cyclase domain-containing protein [Thermoproteota archaeon]